MRDLLNDAAQLTFMLSVIPLALLSLVSLAVSTIQTLVSIQEQSLAFTLKFLSGSLLLLFGGSWFCEHLAQFAARCLAFIEIVGHS